MERKYYIFIGLIIIFLYFSGYYFIMNEKKPIDKFKSLKKGMSYEEMINLVGEPDRDIGSGVHIYLYRLSDKSEVIIGFLNNKLSYVKQKISNGNYIDIIP